MRLLHRISKRSTEPVVYPIDANPWLQSINSTFAGYSLGNAPDLVESSSVANGVVTLSLSGGSEGEVYQLPVTFSAANGMTRSVIVEVSIIGPAPTSTGGSVSPAPTVQDSLAGNPTTLAPSVCAINAALTAVNEAIADVAANAGNGGFGDIDGGLPDTSFTGTSSLDGGSP